MNDFTVLIARSLRTYLRQPAAIIPGFAIAVFFLFVYNAGLSSVASLPGFQGSIIDQPFAHKAAKERNTGNGSRSYQPKDHGHGHPFA